MHDNPLSLTITFDDNKKQTIVQMHQRPVIVGQTIPVDMTAKALGLKSDDLKVDNLVPTVVQTEVAHAMVPVKNREVLNNCIPGNKLLIEISKRYQFEGFYCFTTTDQKQGHIAESRFFNPLIGIDEDAATGTAAGPLTGFLAKNNYIQHNKAYKILQGVKLNQPSLIDVMVRDNDILVGGSSIITMQGVLYL
jgi:PhzF family phenazine biosynthesis protein